jgi:hypothetical protein
MGDGSLLYYYYIYILRPRIRIIIIIIIFNLWLGKNKWYLGVFICINKGILRNLVEISFHSDWKIWLLLLLFLFFFKKKSQKILRYTRSQLDTCTSYTCQILTRV